MSRVSVSEDVQVRKIKLTQLVEFRSRLAYKDLDELAKSMTQHGQIEPLIVRKKAGKKDLYEIAAGTRRRRAAAIAGIVNVDCVVRKLTDQQMVEISVAENRDRDDIHPLEEADAFVELHDTYGVPTAEIAARFGRSDEYVWGRIRISKMHEDLRAAFLANRFGVKGALALAGVAATMQQRVWEEVSKLPDAPISALKITGLIRDRFLLRLSVAPFSIEDETLVSAAGACVKCPKRTNVQASLFSEDITSEDRCTDADCFGEKKQAQATNLIEKATEQNLRVLEKVDAREVFRFGESIDALNPDCEFVAVDGKVRLGGDGVTYRDLLVDCAPPIVVAINPGGAGIELYEKTAVAKAMQVLKVPFAREWESVCLPKRPSGSNRAVTEKSDKSAAKVERRAAELAIGVVRVECAEATTNSKLMQVVAMGAVRNTWAQVQKMYIKLHGLDDSKTGGDANARILAMFEDHVGKMSAGECIGLVVELALLREVLGSSGAPDVESVTFKQALAVLGFRWARFLSAAKKERERGKGAPKRGKGASGVTKRLRRRKGAMQAGNEESEEAPVNGFGGGCCSVCSCTRGEPCDRDGVTCTRGVGEERCNLCDGILEVVIQACEEKQHPFSFEEVFGAALVHGLVLDIEGDHDVVRSCLDQMIEYQLVEKLDDGRYQNVKQIETQGA